MIGYMVAVITGIILLMIVGNQGGIGHLNAYMERSGCRHKRVKEPKILFPYIQHEDIDNNYYGGASDIKYDGTVYITILIVVIINLVLCILLVTAVLIAGLIFDYLMWWAFLIAVGYTAYILGASAYYHNKYKKQKREKNFKE